MSRLPLSARELVVLVVLTSSVLCGLVAAAYLFCLLWMSW